MSVTNQTYTPDGSKTRKVSGFLKTLLQQREVSIFLSVLALGALLAFNSPNFLGAGTCLPWSWACHSI